jgi:catechol 2,3-dioxygenase-like lactoylglutathione lyase family enzyme
MKIEVVVLPVSDVDRAKQFYKALGWREDADVVADGGTRIVQLTPPGSPCSVQFGTGLTAAAPGSAQGTYLVVDDLEAARAELLEHGAQVSETYHEASAGARFQPVGAAGRRPGPDPDGGTYRSFASFTDPDGNGWLLQQITTRLPGRD